MVRLSVYDGAARVRELELESSLVTIGRDDGNVLVLADASVSRRHAAIEPAGNFYLVRDNGSTNGTFVNEMLVRTHVLTHGDVVRVGKYLLRLDARSKKVSDSTQVRVEKLNVPGAEPGTPSFREPRPNDVAQSRLSHLCELAGLIGPVGDPSVVEQRVLEIALGELNADRGCLLRRSPEVREGASAAGAFESRAARSPTGEEQILVPEQLLAAMEKQNSAVCTQLGAPPGRSVLLAPLKTHAGIEGAIYMERPPTRSPFGDEEIELLGAIAGVAAVSLANSALCLAALEARERLQVVLTSLKGGLLVTDQDLKILEVNRTASELLGWKNTAPLGKPLFETLAEIELTPPAAELRGRAVKGLETRLKATRQGGKKAGAPELAGALVPFRKGSGEPAGYLLLLREPAVDETGPQSPAAVLHTALARLKEPLEALEAGGTALRSGKLDHAQAAALLDRCELELRRAVGDLTAQSVAASPATVEAR